MSITLDHTETDTRTRVLLTAERLFREIGYQKTTVADIAKTLKMSPANVYRFFDSKKAIHEGVAVRLMSEVETAVTAIADDRRLSATDRLREMFAAIHHMNAERYVGDSKLHEMVAIAMEESWQICEAHIQRECETIARVIAEGVERGEFKPCDPLPTALCVCASMLRFFHPQMIAQCANKPLPTLEQMTEFVIAGISVPKT
ncbi:TetR family transcriptional regulator [Afipia sp. P52-10]|jgi:AcrR family transcriptional regulator|uniref:TetR/AcrR family transcriptional regulator n=1 Tax=Afipia sp. P52-10 TaxID=1429916 RepID=UPI0003DF08AA|nr:TetR/AcrR family transcriptional regulator [Afipia sp. P52-10]ETR78053.1 TetR family transcriptional regulator [Afipia sp. P52-10]